MPRRLRSYAAGACLLVSLWSTTASAQSPARWLEGMWSNPPDSIVGLLCGGACSQVAIDALDALIDDPTNDRVPYTELRTKALERQNDYVRSVLVPDAARTFPLDPADDPSFLRCEPYGLARQIFAPHQLEIRIREGDQLDFHYGEWDAHRTIALNGRVGQAGAQRRFGHSVGRWDGDEFVIETIGIPAGLVGRLDASFQHSDQLRIVERYSRAENGKVLWMTATLTDPVSLRQPLVLKRMWRWSPNSEIAPYENCEIPPEIKRGVRP